MASLNNVLAQKLGKVMRECQDLRKKLEGGNQEQERLDLIEDALKETLMLLGATAQEPLEVDGMVGYIDRTSEFVQREMPDELWNQIKATYGPGVLKSKQPVEICSECHTMLTYQSRVGKLFLMETKPRKLPPVVITPIAPSVAHPQHAAA